MNQLVEQKPLSVKEVAGQMAHIQEIMKAVMKKDEHYGIIPGCKKPSLLKPGAEKIASTFHIHIESEVEDLSIFGEIARFRVTCKAYNNSGVLLGSSVGTCSSDEEKYKWKKPTCDEEWQETDPLWRREKWQKWGNKKAEKIKQIRTQPADLENTILQMADKRAYVSIVRKVTAASDVFAMDIEDLPKDMLDKDDTREPIKQAESKQADEVQQSTVPSGDIISEPQRKRLFAISKTANVSESDMKAFLAFCGFESSKDITKDAYNDICEKVEAGNVQITSNIDGCNMNPAECDHSEYQGQEVFCKADKGRVCKFNKESSLA